MDIQKAFTFITDDEAWIQKLAIGVGVILASVILSVILVGILGFLILAGYTIRLLQNVRDGVPKPLPEWDDWGGDLSRGFKYAIVGLIWGLPLIIFSVPSSIGSALAQNGGNAAQFIGSIVTVCAGCLSFIYGVFLALAQPGFTISFARDEKISSGLMLTDIWEWTRANLGQVIIVSLVAIGAALVIFLGASVIGALLCGIGLIVTLPLAGLVTSLVQHHLYGQLARGCPMYPVRSVPAVPPAPVAPMADEPVMPTPDAETEMWADEITPADDAAAPQTGDVADEDVTVEQIDVTAVDIDAPPADAPEAGDDMPRQGA